MEDTPLQTTERRSRPSIRILAMLAAVAVGAFALDQLTKALVVSSMTEGQTIEALGGFLQWHFVRNPGAAFSFAAGSTWIFTGVSFGFRTRRCCQDMHSSVRRRAGREG